MANDDLTNKTPVTSDADDSGLNRVGSIVPPDSNVLNAIRLSSGYSTTDSAISASYYGFNHSNSVSPVSANTKNSGLVFFTKPRMNLGFDNIVLDRLFTNLAVGDSNSIGAVIRASLDPVGAKRPVASGGFPSRLVDNRCAFIPVLSNNLVSLSGWPDPFVDVYTTSRGRYNEEWTMIDGFPKLFGTFQITATFRNVVQDPIALMMYYWMIYGAMVHEGRLDPHFDSLIAREIDYNTKIYRLTLDSSKKYVQEMGVTIAFPTTSNLGSIFDFSKDEKITRPWDDTTTTFQCVGAEYLDPILMKEFNDTVQMHNHDMFDGIRESKYIKVTGDVKTQHNYLGYPHINLATGELEWWVDPNDNSQIKGFYL